MSRKKTNKDRYNFLIDKAIYADFSMVCEELGLIRSKSIERHMHQFVEEHKELLKRLKDGKK
ncbi:MAG TPA: hypothetical protein VJH97_02240 [Candidatus Nanoarchaeia archaeon]|nr:hypothetical protein [Candidatus Nanoarchaeia archaeon]